MPRPAPAAPAAESQESLLRRIADLEAALKANVNQVSSPPVTPIATVPAPSPTSNLEKMLEKTLLAVGSLAESQAKLASSTSPAETNSGAHHQKSGEKKSVSTEEPPPSPANDGESESDSDEDDDDKYIKTPDGTTVT